jgi:ribosomal protein L40E
MAMTTCLECNSALPSDAESCPTCGHPLPRPKKPINAVNVVSVVVVCLGCGLLCNYLYRLFVSVQVSATKTAPLSNVKKIGTGLALYIMDNDDLYPSSFGSNQALKEVLRPYLKSDELFISYNPNGSVLLPNQQLQSYLLTKVVDEKNTVTIYESNEWPEGGKYYGFVDTHAGFLRSEEGIKFDPKK